MRRPCCSRAHTPDSDPRGTASHPAVQSPRASAAGRTSPARRGSAGITPAATRSEPPLVAHRRDRCSGTYRHASARASPDRTELEHRRYRDEAHALAREIPRQLAQSRRRNSAGPCVPTTGLRPSQQRADDRTRAPRRLLCREAAVPPCAPVPRLFCDGYPSSYRDCRKRIRAARLPPGRGGGRNEP
jgi:hypothetical protein